MIPRGKERGNRQQGLKRPRIIEIDNRGVPQKDVHWFPWHIHFLIYPCGGIFRQKKGSWKDSKYMNSLSFRCWFWICKKNNILLWQFSEIQHGFRVTLHKHPLELFSEKIWLVKICSWVLAIERWKPQVSTLFLSKIIQKTSECLDFWNG
jgi:hypothetical protein